MVTRYLALGASVDDVEQRPLVVACQNGHEDVVGTLLAYGADISLLALEIAVRYGHFAIVFLLLSYNVEVGKGVAEGVAKGYNPIVRALLERKTDAKL